MISPNLIFERKLWRKNFSVVGGVDEVGRGALAGPVVAGCVVFPKHFSLEDIPEGISINDSKKLTPIKRSLANKWIKNNSLTWGIGKATVAQINKLGIVKATKIAFRRGVANANRRLCLKSKTKQIDYLLLDAFFVNYVPCLPSVGKNKCRQTPIIKGDTKSISIAAASIIAKVYRDRLMTKLSQIPKYKKYGWDENKGYGTKKHTRALTQCGATKVHRKLFIDSII